MSTGPDRTPAPVTAVTIKLPPFWPSDPQLWFAQVEAQFATRGITQQRTKFDYIVASLSPEFATEIRDLVLSPPADTPYDTLKTQLIKRTAASEQRRLQQLFNSEEIGDRKPTQLLRRMQQLLGDKAVTTDKSFLRELFLQRLPPNFRMVLASVADTVSLDELANLADRIMEVATPSVSVIDSQFSAEVGQLRSEVSRLQKLLNSKPPMSNSRSRGRSPSPVRPQPRSDLCWYHQQFGDSARKCKPHCSRSGNTSASH